MCQALCSVFFSLPPPPNCYEAAAIILQARNLEAQKKKMTSPKTARWEGVGHQGV